MKSEWTLSTIGDVCLLVTDGSHFSPKSVENGEPMVSVKDFTPYGFDFSSCRKISDTDYATLKKNGCVPEVEDILIGKDGARYFEDIIIYRQNERPALLSSIAILRCDKSKILPDYLYYILRTPFFRKNVKDNYGSGSAIPRIILKDFKRMPICYPSIKHQKEIISILVALDQHIMTNQKINDNLQQQAKALYAEMFLSRSNDDVISGTLSDIAVITMGQSPSGSSYNEDGVGEVFYQGRAEFGFRFPKRRLFTTEPKRMAETGDVLLSVRAPVGDLNVAYEGCCIGRGLGAIHSKTGHSSFVLYTMFALRSQLDVFNGEGTVFGSINRDALNAIPIDIPPVTEINQFEAIAHPIDELIRANYEENCRLEAIRDSLLPKLMSGEIDVSAVQL